MKLSSTSRDISTIVADIREEQHISPFIDDKAIKNFIKSGIQSIEDNVGFEINFEKDLIARELLKNYVLYANHNRLAEFKELYGGDYIALQRKYYTHSQLQ